MTESDGDLHGALVSFFELAGAHNDAVAYRILHIEECLEVMMERKSDTEPLEAHLSSKRPNADTDGAAAKRPKHV